MMPASRELDTVILLKARPDQVFASPAVAEWEVRAVNLLGPPAWLNGGAMYDTMEVGDACDH